MAKVTINGEVYGFDLTRKPMSEALALEEALKVPYATWETDIQKGSARAVCGLIWLVLRRNGHDVPLQEILDGTFPVDLGEFNVEDDDGEADPTTPTRQLSGTTGSATSARSPRSSTSAPGKSAS